MMQDRYDELFELLEEAQEDARRLRRKQKLRESDGYKPEESSEANNSLATELEASLKQQTELKEQIEIKEMQIEHHIEQHFEQHLEQAQQLSAADPSNETTETVNDRISKSRIRY